MARIDAPSMQKQRGLKEKRSQKETCRDVLILADGRPVLKTTLMHEANLSYDALCFYLDVLLDKEFLEKRQATGQGDFVYEATEAGRAFLSAMQAVDGLWHEGAPERPAIVSGRKKQERGRRA